MAISHLLPRKSTKSRSRKQTLSDRLAYDQKDEKTGKGELVSAYMCCAEICCKGGVKTNINIAQWLSICGEC